MKLVLSIVLLFLFSRITAQMPNSSDTIDIPQVTIIDDKLEKFQIDNKLIDSSFIINNLNTSLSDILLKNTSLYSRTYGPGLIASYGIRGSNSSETVVLWNDFPVNNIMLASTDVSLLAIHSGSKIKILKNNSISGGIGGTINIEDGATDNVSGDVGLSYSSLLNFDFNGSGRFLIGKFKNSLSIVFSKSKNEFEYTRGKSKIKTSNSDASKAVLNYNATYVKKNKIFKLFVLANKLFRQIPPSRFESFSDANQLDEGIKSGLHFEISENKLLFKFKAGYFIDRLRYQYLLKNIYSDSYIYTFHLGLKMDWNIIDSWLLNLYTNNENYKVDTDIYGKKYEDRLHFSGVLKGSITDKFLIKSGLKTVYYNDKLIPLSPFFQLDYPFSKIVKFSFNSGMNYRLPGFNEKYWPNLGVADLKYERSSYIDLATHINIKELFDINSSFYFKKTRNMINWVPEDGLWRPVNIDLVYSRGVDVDMSTEFYINKIRSKILLSYSYNVSTKKKEPDLNIIYSPKHIVVSTQRFNYRSWRISFTQRYTGKVYVAFDNSQYIPAYIVVDAGMSKDFKIKRNRLKYIIEIYNVLNKDYETIKNYPMPGRYLSMGLKYIL